MIEEAVNSATDDQGVKWFTIVGYRRLCQPVSDWSFEQFCDEEEQVTTFCMAHEVPMGAVPDPRFGTVKTYPKWVLDDLFLTRQ